MKKFISLTVLLIIIAACSTPEATNTAPNAPSLSSPKGGACVAPSVVFQWNSSSDAEGNAITYRLEVSKTNSFEEILNSVDGTTVSQTIALENSKSYYWRVKATDDKGLSSAYSEVANFTTASNATNQLPNTPELILPALETSVSTATTTLKWSATDPNEGDKLVYDVYFGINPTPTPTDLKFPGISETSKDVDLPTNGVYYWKVVARDATGETVGQVWSFTKVAP